MRGVNTSLLKTLLSFLYSGSVEIEEQKLNQFVALAEDLGLEGLGQRHFEDKKPCIQKNLEAQEQDEKKVAILEPNLAVKPPGSETQNV